MTASRRAPLGRRRRMTALLLPLVAGVLLLVAPPSALAHDGLVGTSPGAGTTVETAPATVQLDFTGEPLPLGTQVAVVGPDGGTVSDGPAEIRGTSVVQALAADLPAGSYRVDWRSTSSDGHPLSGSFDFTVATGSAPAGPASAAPDSAAPSPEPVAPSPAAAGDDVDAAPADDGLPVWPVVAAVSLIGLGALVVDRLRRRA
ncbi:copper resistance CopC family protein [Blastococcus sp. VKM Ac-2987]|uniref:copper resistance CopC family protein n=1 Tax=Blastococcus sp. VKM Ac-2987 TaxID=3004141 RepID=UPI0022AB9DE6|nr:copper resistance protein CopC [Blastococcus sp. VKM Ac-2987]MCZ2860904.1 copper resistance protein CopC [Blastococcus sp. VKM Ac-2987]